MIRFPGLGPTVRKKKKKKRRETASPEPLRVLIGSTNGTRQDAESLARTQIERYFDTPDRSWFFVVQERGVGHHFEVHQGGDGRPYLPTLLNLELEPEETLIIRPESRTAVEIMLRADQTFQSLVLPERQSEGLVTDVRLGRPARKKMRPYATTGAEWIKVGIAAISLGLLTITVAGILHKSFSVALNGYHEIADTLPVSRLIELGGGSPRALPIHELHQLPVNQWHMVESMPLQPGERVDRLVYEHGSWNTHTALTAGVFPEVSATEEDGSIPYEWEHEGADLGDVDHEAEGRWAEDGSDNWGTENEWHDDAAYEAVESSHWEDEPYPTAHEVSMPGGAR
jgi:hypothetical protein